MTKKGTKDLFYFNVTNDNGYLFTCLYNDSLMYVNNLVLPYDYIIKNVVLTT